LLGRYKPLFQEIETVLSRSLCRMPEPITHACISYVVARHCCRQHKPLFVWSGLSPDIDVAIGGLYILIRGPLPGSIFEFAERSLIFHPTLSSSLFFLPFFPLLMLLFFRFVKPAMVPSDLRKGYLIVLAGVLLHLGLDMLQTGNRPFWPLALDAGFDILPYSAKGRGITLAIALGLLLVDIGLFSFLRRRSNSAT